MPVFSLNGKATYQSTVTTFLSVFLYLVLPNYSRDQYKVYGKLDQVINDGGIISNQKQSAESNEIIQQQNLNVEIYALYDRVINCSLVYYYYSMNN